MFRNIIKFEALLKCESEELKVEGVTFIADFGCWRAGDRATILWIDYEGGKVVEYNCEWIEVRRCAIAVTATLEPRLTGPSPYAQRISKDVIGNR